MPNISKSGIAPQQQIKSEHLLRIIEALSGEAPDIQIEISGPVTASYFIGDGSQLTNLPSGSSIHNDLTGLQGGKPNEPKEYFHLSESQHERVLDLIYMNNSNSFSVNPTSGERGINNSLNLNYNIISNDDIFTSASINQGIGSVLANINTGNKTVSGGSSLVNKAFTLTLGFTRNGVANIETKTATYFAYAPQFAGVSTNADLNTYALMSAALQKFVQSSPVITKQSSPVNAYVYFISTKNNAQIFDQNNFQQTVGAWNDGVSEFYLKTITLTLADSVTTETMYLYRSRNVKTLTNFTYKIQ